MGCMDYFDLAQDTDRWRLFVSDVMNLRSIYNSENFLSTEQLLVSQEGLCSVEVFG
jgi:hypothetical protein